MIICVSVQQRMLNKTPIARAAMLSHANWRFFFSRALQSLRDRLALQSPLVNNAFIRVTKMPSKKVPFAFTKTIRGRVYVLVEWDDRTSGSSHYVPISTLTCEGNGAITGGVSVAMRHGKKIWSGKVVHTGEKPLVEGKSIFSCQLLSRPTPMFYCCHVIQLGRPHEGGDRVPMKSRTLRNASNSKSTAVGN